MPELKAIGTPLYSRPLFAWSAWLIALITSYFSAKGGLHGFALDHWLITYQGGFIKRGLTGTVFQLPILASLTGTSIQTTFWWLSNIMLLVLIVALLAIAYRIYTLQRQYAYAVIPYLMIGPLIQTNASYIGYLDQIFEFMAILTAYLLLRRKNIVAAIVGTLAILVHETSFVLIVPLVLFWWLLQYYLASTNSNIKIYDWIKNITWREWILLALPTCSFIAIFIYYEYFLVWEEKSNYICNRFLSLDANRDVISSNISQYQAFCSYYNSLSRTLLTSFGSWYTSESEGFYYQLFNAKGLLLTVLPAVLISMSVTTPKNSPIRTLCFRNLMLLLLLSPLSVFVVAWDAERIWSYPLVLLLLFLWIFLEESREKAPVSASLRWGMFVVVLLMLTVTFFSHHNLASPMLALGYTPLLLWYAGYFRSKKKESSS